MTGPVPVDLVARERRGGPSWTVELPVSKAAWEANVLSMNDRLTPFPKAERTKFWRAFMAAASRRAPRFRGGRVVVWFAPPTRGKGSVHEVANLQPMVKALVDGMVDAGVFPGDSDAVVWGQDARRLPKAGAPRIVVQVWGEHAR